MRTLSQYTILFLSFLLPITTAYTQDSELDSLKAIWVEAPKDTSSYAIYEEVLKKLYYAYEIETMRDLSQEAVELFQKLDYPKGIQRALFFKASALIYLGQNEEALALFKEGRELCFQIKDTLSAANHFINGGLVYHRMGQWDEALKGYLSAYKIYEQYDSQENLSKVLNNIASIYRTQERYEEAITIYDRSIKIKRSLNDSLGLANTYQNLGILYSYIDEMELSIKYLNDALGLYTVLENDEDVIKCLNALGSIYMNLGCYEEAWDVLLEAEDYTQKDKDIWNASAQHYMLGAIALEKRAYQKAESYLESSILHSQQGSLQKNLQVAYFKLSGAKKELGKHKSAYDALLQAYLLQDSLKEERRLALMEEMQAQYDVLAKENELAVNQLVLEKRTQQRNMLIAVVLSLVLMGGLLLYAFLQRMRIASQKEELQQQRIIQLQQDQQLTAMNAVIEGEEKERMRIASDLHDSLGGLLTAAKAHVSHLSIGLEQEVDKATKMIDDACVEVRRISHNMLPKALSISGLKAALEDIVVNIQHQGYSCKFNAIGLDEKRLGKRSLAVYRILQELINNAMKHANADKLNIQLFMRDDFLFITVEDDGVGFDVESARLKKGLGLSSVESRVKVMNGEVEWDSEVGEGTSVSIRIPVDA